MPIKVLNTLLRVVVDQGMPIERALQLIELDFNPLLPANQHRTEIATESYSKLYRLLMELLQDEAFGLGQEYHAPPGTFRMMCLFVINCSTLRDALLRAAEFHDYCDQYRDLRRDTLDPIVTLDGGEEVLCLFDRSTEGTHSQHPIGHANVLLMMYRFYSWLIGKDMPLQAVHLRSQTPESGTHYERLFHCPVLFEQPRSGLVIRSGLLAHPVAQNEASLKEFLRQTPYQLVKPGRPEGVKPLSRKVEQLLAGYPAQKQPTAERIAQELNMSPRSLHRKLTAEGASFQTIKDSQRRELAIHYISRPELTIDAISTLMGFQDNSAFYRSFKKWTGHSPGQYRLTIATRGKDGDRQQ